MKSMTVREISAETTYEIRSEVLRPGKPMEECFFDGDHAKNTFHLGVFIQDKLIGVASYMQNCNPLFSTPLQFQLRGMAILQDYKQQGYGAALLKAGEARIFAQYKDPLLWFNARIQAVGFYKKFGYQTKGEEFDVPGVCKHIVMFKPL